MIGFIGAAILYVVLVVMFLIAKNQLLSPGINRVDLHLVRKKMRQYKVMSILIAIAFILSASVAFGRGYYMKLSHFNFQHVHGVSFTNDGELMVATHVGIFYYSNRLWTMSHFPPNDYMGFTKVDDGFYSSGHPGKETDMPNPLGIIKVDQDHGNKVTSIDFTGLAEFYGLSAGYYTHTLYAYNTTVNNKMNHKGLYVSKDNGETWIMCQLVGVKGDMTSFAASPSYPSMVAVGTNHGVFISRDFGQSFKNYFEGLKVTAITFEENGDILFAGLSQKPHLFKWNLASNRIISVPLPDLYQGGIAYIGISSSGKKIAIASFNNNVYLSENEGRDWSQIATEGKTS